MKNLYNIMLNNYNSVFGEFDSQKKIIIYDRQNRINYVKYIILKQKLKKIKKKIFSNSKTWLRRVISNYLFF